MSSRRSSLAQTANGPPAVPSSPKGHPLSRSSSTHSHLSLWSRKTDPRRDSSDASSTSAPTNTIPGERNPWAGHLGHLTVEQQQALEEFKQDLSAKGIFFEDGRREEGGGQGRGRVDDSTLLRFLRARKFDVQGAVNQYCAFVDWRKAKNVDEAYEEYTVEDFEALRRCYPMWTGRRDHRGIPIYVYKIASLTPATLKRLIPSDDASSSSIAVITLALIRFLLPFTSALPREHGETPVSGTNSIVDVGGVGLSRFWGLRDHLQVASQVASANFPETIDRVFVVGAPSFFPTVFNWAKKWFDPGTVDKIHILSTDTLSTLLSMMPASAIPREYGGELDWTYGDDPNLDAEALEQIGGKWVPGPIVWDLTEGGRVKPVGKSGGVRRDKDYVSGPSTPAQSRPSSVVVEDRHQVPTMSGTSSSEGHGIASGIVGAGLAGGAVGAGPSWGGNPDGNSNGVSNTHPVSNGNGYQTASALQSYSFATNGNTASHSKTSSYPSHHPSPLHTSTTSRQHSPSSSPNPPPPQQLFNENSSNHPPPNQLPNGHSPNPHPAPEPATRYIPGTHSPVNHDNLPLPFSESKNASTDRTRPASSSQIPPVDQEMIDARVRERERSARISDEGEGGMNRATRNRTQTDAAKKGWVPGSGVTEEEFMKAFGGGMGITA